MAFFTEDENNQFKEHGFIRKPGVVDRKLLDKAADRFYETMGVDRNDPKTFINAGPPSQNLKAGIARSTGDDGSIYREIGKSGEGEGLPSFVASSPETKCLVKLKWEPRARDISLSKPWSRFRWRFCSRGR